MDCLETFENSIGHVFNWLASFVDIELSEEATVVQHFFNHPRKTDWNLKPLPSLSFCGLEEVGKRLDNQRVEGISYTRQIYVLAVPTFNHNLLANELPLLMDARDARPVVEILN